jgi:excisionase family DNA binding protein
MKRKGAEKEIFPSKVMTVPEVSAYLKVHPSTVYRLLRRHQIPAFRIGSDWRFNVDAIDAWCSRKEKAGDV